MTSTQNQDLDAPATKRDLLGFTTKEDLKRFATKEDLKRFATKQDLLELREATKKDLTEGFGIMNQSFQELQNMLQEGIGKIDRQGERTDRAIAIATEVRQELQMHEHGVSAHDEIKGRIENVEHRVTRLEEKLA